MGTMPSRTDGDAPAFRCPRCDMVSAHPTDLAEGYCGACHAWTGKVGRAGGAGLASHDVGYYDDPPTERCRPVLDEDGHVVAMVLGGVEPSERGRVAMLAVVAAAQRLAAQLDTPESRARHAAVWARLDERRRLYRAGLVRRSMMYAMYRRRSR